MNSVNWATKMAKATPTAVKKLTIPIPCFSCALFVISELSDELESARRANLRAWFVIVDAVSKIELLIGHKAAGGDASPDITDAMAR